MVISSRGSAKVADRSPFKIHRELKSILGDETIEVTKLGSGDLMVELKSNDQAKKLGAIATFLDIPVTVSPHKSLNSSKGVIRSRDLRCCSEEEMVEELSGVTHARRIKVRRGEDKIQTDTVVLTSDSPKPPSRIRAGYLTLDVRPYVPLPMAAISANAMATARTGVRNLLLYVLDVARVVMSNVTVRLIPFAKLQRKPCSQQQDLQISSSNEASSAPQGWQQKCPFCPAQGEKAQKDSPAPSPQGAAEAEVPAKRRAEKSKRQEVPRETVNRFAPLAMDAEDTITSIWGDSSTPSSPRASASPMECPPSPSKFRLPPSAEKSQGPPPSPSPPYPFTPEVHVTEGVKPTKKTKGLAGQPKAGLPSNK
ncbi:RNA-directed DNA polymerase from mobile element jockey [Plakobranchus ocellatus]|uniref:RNA-directed DNA polymerase from mobile element jockey n=1 Tax=Plakobranchus ocellatus TaxID=259542 RepID=A0AAV4DS49_9GAST|nr:RNA-directed DNA polymerase from mobile element jockey [Plakobranchus ocellatus]